MQQAATFQTLSVAIFPKDTLVRSALLVGAAVLFIALSAQVSWSIPLNETKAGDPVPITGQTFAVLVTGALLGSRLGTLAVFAYLVAGVAGAPVFADGSRYYSTFSGATGGYLIGFLPAAFIVGWFAERGWDKSAWLVLVMVAANAIIYVPGLIWLNAWTHVIDIPGASWSLSLDFGLWPFILGDTLKIIAASLVLPVGWSIMRVIRNKPPE